MLKIRRYGILDIPPETVIRLAGGWSRCGQDGDVEIFNPDC
jgi:hypothetical protein